MRYSQDHKAQTHQRIIKEASVRFRRDGIGATGLQPLMKALNLTHGGFYAHFRSKDELVEKALQEAAAQLDEHCKKLFSQQRPLDAFIDSYLSQWHQTSPHEGCPLPTMSSELGLRGQNSRTTDEVLNARLKQVEAALDSPNAREQGLVLMSTLVGALVLARSVESAELATRILDVVRGSLKAGFCGQKKAGQ
ncbi:MULTISPECIES: TetR/AcrR family transcriptional regulator [unclassified Pseudomonas]|jgi:TetR/AcrR family transcriptional regulator, transcriptional repressor for nem operon|uniref:TetR/AcrR family transcriptional regulator n=1 Tax=unclassified Pseudomonas TaxID=196821 RepID=UPI0015A05A54|nr:MULTISPECIES: TetR/AcrR family transcriptional regulator [unclassified Pseudomonas]MBT1266743.1 TetR/AcrR family transcriptional regulator [Pseudomonas sp. VS38]NWB07932.1 TetR/AcrR family transcriptional regulator [Pseudomonas sp. D5002]NWB59941.1 TetR/AcrR family transcriptional regulator [Pseudomonas sp. F1002]NWB74983.1 TetR/AcrR family transcriptional regulator [Pseudomonas sp. G5001]NWC05661.1 TetR/AcrR family transcriptional regulator [Pseudomonas sp. G1002]